MNQFRRICGSIALAHPFQRIFIAAVFLAALPVALIPSAGGQSQAQVALFAGDNYAIAGGDSFSVIGFSTDGNSATLQFSIASRGNAPSLSLARLSKGQTAFLSTSSVSFLGASPSADGRLEGAFSVSFPSASGQVSPTPPADGTSASPMSSVSPAPSPNAIANALPSAPASPILVLKEKLLASIASRRPAASGESVKFQVDISTCPHKLPGPCLYASRFGKASYEISGGIPAETEAPAVEQAAGGKEAAAAGKVTGGRQASEGNGAAAAGGPSRGKQVAHFTTGYVEVYDKTGRKLGAWSVN